MTAADAEAASETWLLPSDRPLDQGGPTTQFPLLRDDFLERPIIVAFRDVAARQRDEVAIIDSTGQLTYGELLDAADALARQVAAAAEPNAAVGIVMPSSCSFAIAALACLAAGRIFAALDSYYPVQRNQEIIQQAGLSLLIIDSRYVQMDHPTLCGVPVLDLATIAGRGDAADSSESQLLPSEPDQPAIILHTSGSTGRPKGIVNSQASLLQRVRQHVEALHLGSEDVLLLLSSFCTIAGMREALTALLTGSLLVVADVERSGIRATRNVIREQGVSVIYAVPALMMALVGDEGAPDDFVSLRVVRLGGDRMLWDDLATVRRALPTGCHIQISYSSTETTGAQWFVPPGYVGSGSCVPVGYILPGLAYAVLDDDGSPVPSGKVGELVVRGRYVALGEWRDGRCVPGVMATDARDPASRIFHTGDLVRVLPDGLIEIISRKDRQVKINGRRVEPAELEVVLRRSANVRDAAVIARQSQNQTILLAFAVPSMGAPASLQEDLQAMIRRTLPRALHPARLHLIAELPRLPNAKLDVQALREMDETRQRQYAGAGRRLAQDVGSVDIRTMVARIWRRLLRESVPEHRSWDAAGGDSLKLLRFVFEAERALGCDLPLDRFDMSMTQAGFVQTIEAHLASPSRSVATDDRPTIFFLAGLAGDSPALASLRAELRELAQIVPLPYQDWRALATSSGTVEAAAELALAEIIRIAPAGKINLASYSFGGAVALVVAHRLIEMGRQVGHFTVFDTNIAPAANQIGPSNLPTGRRVQRALLRVAQNDDSLVALLSRWLTAPSRRWLLRSLARSRMLSKSGSWFTLQQELGVALRWRAYHRWVLEGHAIRIPGKAVLYRSQQRREDALPDLGWGRHFVEVDKVPVGGDHLSMFVQPHRAALTARFVEQLAEHPAKRFHTEAAENHRDARGKN